MPEATQRDASEADVGLVCALALEVDAFFERCESVRSYTGGPFRFRGGRWKGIRIVAVEAGIGRVRATRAVQALVDAHTPRWVVSCGFSGGLQPGLQVGDVVVGQQIVHPAEPAVAIDFAASPEGQGAGWRAGTVLTVDEIVRSAAQKQQLGEQWQALAVDMESHAVASWCKAHHQLCLVARVISDDCQSDLPPEVLTVTGETGAVRFGAVLGALWKRPTCVNDLLSLRERAQLASEKLAEFLRVAIPPLSRAPVPSRAAASSGQGG
jgi:adenosylhomocysteine nucleosidase